MIRGFLIALVFTSVAGAAQAQLRTIPEDARRGNLTPVQGMAVDIDGKRVELAAGAQIRDGRNMIILPNALPQASMIAKYQLGQDGKLQRAWLLTPQEAAQPDVKR